MGIGKIYILLDYFLFKLILKINFNLYIIIIILFYFIYFFCLRI